MDYTDLESLLAVARGEAPADLLLTNARVVNTLSYEIVDTSVALHCGRIAGFGDRPALQTLDLRGAFLTPAFIDGHIHIESSLLTPAEFARMVVPRGTGAVVCDPHELANVWGTAGIQYMLDASANLPLDVLVMLPSCVPSTPLETSGACLDADQLRTFLAHPRVIGLAEVMDYTGVIRGDADVMAKLRLAADRPIDGHAPGVNGAALDAYCAAGIETDHECTTVHEARDKLRRGLAILIREGSTARNLEALLPLVTPVTAHRFAFVSDDRHADDLLAVGHVNAILRQAVARGLDPVLTIAMATSHTAAIYGRNDLGAIAPGRIANLVALNDLRSFDASHVWHHGVLVARDGELIAALPEPSVRPLPPSVLIADSAIDDLSIPARSRQTLAIDIIPDQLVTNKLSVELPVNNSCWTADAKQNIAKLVVLERHGRSGTVGKSFVRGLGLQSGALASTVAHDSHNLVCAGMNDADMQVAIRALRDCGGGLVVVENSAVRALLPLSIAGLMSDRSAREVVAALVKLHHAASALGCTLAAPFMALAFLALPVIPHLKLTDRGLVDVDTMSLID
jgi:adenine deaminase